jgi:hypothetical protein
MFSSKTNDLAAAAFGSEIKKGSYLIYKLREPESQRNWRNNQLATVKADTSEYKRR